MAFIQVFAALLLVAGASAQYTLYCPALGGIQHNWNPNINNVIYIQTSFSSGGTYNGGMNCYFDININIDGRVIVSVLQNDIQYYEATISIRNTILSGFLAGWDRFTYNADMHANFISTRSRQMFISFTTSFKNVGYSQGVRLALTFLRPNECPSSYIQVPLAGQQHCVGTPVAKGFEFGDAQRYCNRMRSNLLVADQDNVTSVLSRTGAANVWIGMTAEPSGSYSAYRWINTLAVSPRQPVLCSGDCKPGSTAHRCVYAANSQLLVQGRCSTNLVPLCFMPAGGTDTFFKGSAAVRASGALLAGAVALLWGLLLR